MQRIRFIMEPVNIKFEYLNGAYSELADLLGEEYNGYNIKQLATKYGYSEKWIRKILKQHIGN